MVIAGAGVAGLTLGNFLLRSGIDCVILEKRSREYVEQRQRAGVIDTRAARMFREWGLEDRVIEGAPVKPVLNFRIDGVWGCLVGDVVQRSLSGRHRIDKGDRLRVRRRLRR
ncbi:FAD-dependent monooxygenase [Streptomyces hesseae]|uniref:FAD-dependent monooxygenase n=1 Tax=Streptomyces hesseae TaxID=3075519 RepID=A0ABU2SK98_9ACTN|nr:FAD-dependent monooxygenase [Streptomyces sp. DSM 40473]MDT0449408.1 FAD-dependent monooxygenase [Streptomyces sp. DSM 40473]